jgi:hypothetical protein
MHLLSWSEINLLKVIFAGLVAGYMMAILGLWGGRIPGLVTLDVADMGRRYIVSDRSSAWFFGLASHLFNSVLLVFIWVKIVAPNLPVSPFLSSLAWGLFLSFFLSGSFLAPISGMGFLGRKTKSHRFMLTNIVLHLFWGGVLGFIYTPS